MPVHEQAVKDIVGTLGKFTIIDSGGGLKFSIPEALLQQIEEFVNSDGQIGDPLLLKTEEHIYRVRRGIEALTAELAHEKFITIRDIGIACVIALLNSTIQDQENDPQSEIRCREAANNLKNWVDKQRDGGKESFSPEFQYPTQIGLPLVGLFMLGLGQTLFKDSEEDFPGEKKLIDCMFLAFILAAPVNILLQYNDYRSKSRNDDVIDGFLSDEEKKAALKEKQRDTAEKILDSIIGTGAAAREVMIFFDKESIKISSEAANPCQSTKTRGGHIALAISEEIGSAGSDSRGGYFWRGREILRTLKLELESRSEPGSEPGTESGSESASGSELERFIRSRQRLFILR